MRAAGLEVDVRSDLDPAESGRSGPGRGRARDPQRHAGDRRGARGRHGSRGRRPRGHRARQRRRRRGNEARRDGGQRAAVERAVGRGADDRADAGAGAQHPAGRRRSQGRQVEPVAVGGRRALRQDARHRRPRPRRRARRAALPRVRDAARRVRPVRERRPRAPARRRADPDARGADRRRRLRHRPPAEDAGDDGSLRRRAAREGQARAADREHRARRDHRRGRARCRDRSRPDRRRRARRVRDGAHHRVAAVRAPERGGDPAPRRVHGRGPGQGGSDDRRAGGARARAASSCRSR